MVEILDASGHRCGGALISSQHVLTNAHCLIETPEKYITVLLGSYSSQQAEKEGLKEEIETICIYPQYEKDIYEIDIAIITLKRPVECSQTILPVCLPDINDNPDYDVPMYVAGWGFTEPIMWNNQSLSEDVDDSHTKEDLLIATFGSEKKSQEVTEDTTEYYDYYGAAPVPQVKNTIPDILQEARVQLIPNEECDKLYNYSSPHANIVCAMHDFGSICMGDSGGPLVYKAQDGRWTLMGLITATDWPCNVTHLPMYFVRTKPFVDNFILPCVQDPSKCTCKAANNTESFTYI
ncbi:chymotrypsin-C-like [Ixodes scapularis]|uniref:chymotrypsin-C-like n=1 Tax=Ixodes scapularis TaxID=6945 RepID=UPI001A9D723E|nr:chymotrypsin-C-like [Ixodes scapularis]